MKITENLYHNLGYDWDAELNSLHGEDLWDTPNENSRNVRKMEGMFNPLRLLLYKFI